MSDNNQPILDIESAEDFDQENFEIMAVAFEKTTLDQKMQSGIQGMINADWILAMVSVHTLKGSCGYIYANRFKEVCRVFQEYVKEDTERITYPSDAPLDMNRPQYKLLPTFTPEKAVRAYELFMPVLDEAILLKKELAKYSKTKIPDNLFENERNQINAKYEQQKAALGMTVTQSQTGTVVFGAAQMKSSKHESAVEKRQQSLIPNDKYQSMNQQQSNIDPPVQAKCCEKCVIF